MPFLADYIAIRDGSFTLSDEQERTFSFNLNGDFFSNGTVNRPFIMFKILVNNSSPSGDPNIPGLAGFGRFDLDINDNVLIDGFSINGDTLIPIGYWEIIQEIDWFRPGQQNTIQFRVVGGSITFSDVILMFQRNIS